MQDHDDGKLGGEDTSVDQSSEEPIFRVLDADRNPPPEENIFAVGSDLSAGTGDAVPAKDRVQSDFGSDFADPSLLFRPPGASEEQASEEVPHEDVAATRESEPDEEDYQIIEAAPAEIEEVGPGLAEKSLGGKPILCLMGEFSAGKSTLSNLLIQTAALPVNVTATQLPPVWISKGDAAPYRVGLDGREFDIELDRLVDVSVEDTAYIRIFHDADLLDHCDLIDMPGISDPNMDADVWGRVIHHADAVIWCSHATQAWRQSEAAVWSMLPPNLYARSFLLLTRMDKILSERDQGRVVKRVARETVGLFRELFPISLTRALAADGDTEKWNASGAEDFSAALHELLAEIGAEKEEAAMAEPAPDPNEPPKYVLPSRIRPKALLARRANSRPVSVPAPLPPL